MLSSLLPSSDSLRRRWRDSAGPDSPGVNLSTARRGPLMATAGTRAVTVRAALRLSLQLTATATAPDTPLRRGEVTIGIIGLGRLGLALARGLQDAPEVGEILGFNRGKAKGEAAAARVRTLRLCASEGEVISRADVVFLWTKPLDARRVLESNREVIRARNSLLVSCIPGVPLHSFTERCAETLPNVNIAVRRGVTLVSYGAGLGAEGCSRVRDILALVGTVYEVSVEDIPIYSALCSCGPALYATAMETMADVLSRCMGYDRELCRRMVRETVSGTIELQERDAVDAAGVVERVAHPGGPSEAGVEVLRAELPPLLETMLGKMGKNWPRPGKPA